MKHQFSLCVWALAAAAACGSVNATQVDAGGGEDMMIASGDFTLAVNPGTLSLDIAGEGSVAVDVTRGEGFTDAISLEATGTPTGVTAEFEATSLPDGTSTTNLTITADDTASPGTTDITITGTAGTLQHTATLSLTLSTITVAGSVRGGTMNVVVRIVGKSATTTDASGNFTFTDVKIPYDVYVQGTEGNILISTFPAINYYKGLTRPDPVLTRPVPGGALVAFTSSSGAIDGARSGGNNAVATLMFWSTGGNVTTQGAGIAGYNSVDADWSPSATTKAGTFFGLQVVRGTLGAPTGYPGYGATAATLTANQSTTVNLSLAAPSTAALTGSVTQPSGFPTPTVTLTQAFGPRALELWTATTQNAASVIPVITEGKAAFHATSTLSGSTTQVVFPALAAATNVAFALPPPPVITGPAANATNVTVTTPFAFTTVADTVYKVSMTSGTANYHVYTATSPVSIPDVPEVPLPSATQYSWTVQGFGPATDANRAADALPLESVQKADFDGAMHFHLSIPSRNFTTQ